MRSRLETERLVLRPFRAMDADFYAELIAERGPRGRWFGATVDGARRIIWRNAEAGKRSGLGLLAIRRRKEGDLIGYCGLIAGTAGIDQPEIAYELLRRAHGHGYATEAAMASSTPRPQPDDTGCGQRSVSGTRRHSEFSRRPDSAAITPRPRSGAAIRSTWFVTFRPAKSWPSRGRPAGSTR